MVHNINIFYLIFVNSVFGDEFFFFFYGQCIILCFITLSLFFHRLHAKKIFL